MPEDVSRGRAPGTATGSLPSEDQSSSPARLEFWLVLFLGLSLPFAAFPIATWNGFAVDLPHIAAATLLLIAFVRYLRGERDLPERRLLLATAVLILLSMTGLVHLAYAGFQFGSFFKTGLHLVFMLLVFLAVGSVRTSWSRSILAALAGLAILIALYGVYQAWAIPRGWHSGVGLLSRFAVRPLRISGYVAGVYRATGPFEEPSWLANYLLDATVYTFFLGLDGPTRRSRVGWSLATVFLFGGLLATGSLGGITTGAVLVLIFVGLGIVRLEVSVTRKLAFVVLVASLALGVLLGLRQTRFGKTLEERAVLAAGALGDDGVAQGPTPSDLGSMTLSGSAYFESARYSLCLWRAAPVFGVGLGQYHAARTRVLPCSRFPATDPWTGMAWCAETGLAGLIGLLGLLVAISAPSRRAPEAAAGLVLARLLVLVFLLKQTHSGSYINLSSWYPLGIAAAARSTRLSRRAGAARVMTADPEVDPPERSSRAGYSGAESRSPIRAAEARS